MDNNMAKLEKELAGQVTRQYVDHDVLSKMLHMLDDYIQEKGLDKEALYYDYLFREESEDWEAEEVIHETEDGKAIKDYYSSTCMYLLELSIQESKIAYVELYEKILTFAKRNTVRKAFDFGGGIGGLCIYLIRNGIESEYVDIPGNTWDYAGFRFKRNGLNIPQRTSKQIRELDATYDLITATDNLEHLKILQEWISLFHKKLKNNGFFVVTSTFRGRGLHLASNYEYDKLANFVTMMQDTGFVLKGQLLKRFGCVFLLPAWLLTKLTNKTSGRLLVFQKR